MIIMLFYWALQSKVLKEGVEGTGDGAGSGWLVGARGGPSGGVCVDGCSEGGKDEEWKGDALFCGCGGGA